MIDVPHLVKNSLAEKMRTDTEAVVELYPTLEWPYYTGHFPGLPVLPAVALIDISQHLAELYFHGGHKCRLKRIESLRIKASVFPGSKVTVVVQKDARTPESFYAVWKDESDGKSLAEMYFETQPAS